MLIVLFVIAVLIFLFVPNLVNQRDKIENRGDKAFTQVVKTQAELFTMNENLPLSYENLLSEHYLTAEQITKAKELEIDLNHLE
ncbi:competence protein ComG [Vagococcus coleopterorum]|uniref:Competence protein ComG n=2 Tax=Vagococcus coleopterorum TaxID=2714946 RepID=A0A6G8APW4_9ENTE|nr:competence protein ComG [Vagococcus coleopterorum]